jgi:hypothetical protein
MIFALEERGSHGLEARATGTGGPLPPPPKIRKFSNEKPASADRLFGSEKSSLASYSLFFFNSLIAIMALEISSGDQL